MSFRGRFLALGCTTDTRPLPAQLLALRRNRRQLKIGNRAIGAHADELRPRTETPCRENKLHRYISHPVHLFVFKADMQYVVMLAASSKLMPELSLGSK